MHTHTKLSTHFIWLLMLAIIANATGLCNAILEPDGALYATTAKYMALNNDWVNLIDKGTDWLDKPHFPFWITAVSYKIFGINSFAYKLPSFLCFLLSCFYTYKLTFKIFNKQTAQLATIIFATSLHVVLSNFDVRAEGYLTAFTIASIYYLYNAMQNGRWLVSIVVAALYAAAAMMTKGIFVLITIGSGFVIYWLTTKQYKEFINPNCIVCINNLICIQKN
jgi:4-amino-4-deoxy-L-arabinose transferase-like glycosyltransferase